MTNEEFDRKAEFLLNQQARFDAGMQELREAQAVSERKLAKAAETAEHALEGVAQLTDIAERFINTTTEGFRVVFESMKHTSDKIDVLIDSQIRTDEMFARHLREHHKGLNGA
ncbi:MAG TPA: hypothetical protein VGQ41_16465 [Pyrinomonadaceae bacterium]|jgi:hypothetical protein|nr:hypothetical protein [Pyrinomonadaceae bacterium]